MGKRRKGEKREEKERGSNTFIAAPVVRNKCVRGVCVCVCAAHAATCREAYHVR